MLTDAEVLAALSQVLSPGELSQALVKILHVPEVWHQLHMPDFLAKAEQLDPELISVPCQLASLVLDSPDPFSLELSLCQAHESQLARLWKNAIADQVGDRDLEEIALLAVGLVRNSFLDNGLANIVQLAFHAPEFWRSPLTCAWPHLNLPEDFLAALVIEGQFVGISLAINILLANMSPSEAANALLDTVPSASSLILIHLQRHGYYNFAETLVEAINSSESDLERITGTSEEHLALGTRCVVSGDVEKARDHLNKAWEVASHTTGLIADQVAEIAGFEGDPVLEVEARQHALRSHPIPIRRAEVGLSLQNIGRTDEALAVLQSTSECLEEQVVYGLARAKLGEITHATEVLHQAVQQLSIGYSCSHRVVKKLLDGLSEISEMQLALKVARWQVQCKPSSIEARVDLSRLLELTGDPTAAAEQANLALALNPNSVTARYALARSLQSSGHPETALPHWQTLAETDPDVLAYLATCALDANNIELARDTAHKLLQDDPNTTRGQLILGKALMVEGNFERAGVHFENAVQESPQDPNTWITLADYQEETGDAITAGETLSSGIQSIPNIGSMHFAYSRWLRRQGRLSEALECVKKATNLDHNQVLWLLEYADLLSELGHNDLALPVLQTAFKHQPGNLEIRQALALAYEQCDELNAATELMQELPSVITPKTHFLAGRILAKSISHDEKHTLEDAVSHLEQARSGGFENMLIDYWLGIAYEHSGHAEQAFQAYQICLHDDTEGNQEFHHDATLGLARSALVNEKVSLALSTLEEERKHNPDSIDLLVLLAQAYLVAELPDEALRVAQHAVDHEPTCEKSLKILFRAAVDAGDKSKAIQVVEQLVEIHPQDVNAWLELASLQQDIGEIKASRHTLATALWIGRRQADTLVKASTLFMKTGEKVSAKFLLKRASRLQPDDMGINQQFAIISEEIGDLQTAFDAWKRCVELKPDDHTVLRHAAKTAWALARRSEAIDFWRRASSKIPDDATILIELARAYLANDEPDLAFSQYASAVEIKSDDADLFLEAGTAIIRFGEPKDALPMLQHAARLAPENIEAQVSLGECLLKLGQPVEAREVLEGSPHNENFPQRAFAMLALAALNTNDLSSAEAALETAVGIPPQAKDDPVWLSKVAFQMGFWRQAVEVLEDWSYKESDASVAVELASLRLRLIDARWLYAEACDAHVHAPDVALTTGDAHQEILELIETCRQADAPAKILDELQLWASISIGQIDVASSQAFNEFVKKNSSANIAHALSIAFIRDERLDLAEGALKTNTNSLAPNSLGPIILGLIYAANKDYARARDAYNLTAKNPAQRPLALFLSARTWAAEGHPTEAASNYNSALAAWPNEPSWHFELASLYQDDGRYDAAVPHYQHAVEASPDNGDFLLALSRALRYSGQLMEAEIIYARVLKSAPSVGEIWKEAGQLALVNGHAKQADDWLARACRLLPSDAHCRISSAHAAMALGQSRKAMDRAKTANRLAPEDFEVLLGMGKILAQQGKYEKALQTFDQALERTNDPLSVQLARCKLLIKIGRASQAEETLRSILETKSDDDRAWFALAETCEATENIEAALEAASQAVSISPSNSSYRLLLGRLCRKCGQLDRALDELSQAQSTSPSDAHVALEIGHIYEARREKAQALEAYNQAIKLEPNNDEAHLQAGLVLKQLKYYQQAARMLERAVELNPKDHDALHQLAAVRALELVHGGSLNSAVSS